MIILEKVEEINKFKIEYYILNDEIENQKTFIEQLKKEIQLIKENEKMLKNNSDFTILEKDNYINSLNDKHLKVMDENEKNNLNLKKL